MNKVNRLSDAYLKSIDSNNYKMLNLNEQATADVKTDADALLNSLDLWQATGRTLDFYGDVVGQKRGALTDEQYRYMIGLRIAINTAQGSYENSIDILTKIFKCKPTDIIIRDSENPCAVVVEKFPVEILVREGITSRQALEWIAQILPICITIDDANFDGTFEFAETADEYDELKGFGNVEQTIGGFLGLLLGDDENSPVLPL